MSEQELIARLQVLESQIASAKAEIRQEIQDETADLRRGLQEAIKLLQEIASKSRY